LFKRREVDNLERVRPLEASSVGQVVGRSDACSLMCAGGPGSIPEAEIPQFVSEGRADQSGGGLQQVSPSRTDHLSRLHTVNWDGSCLKRGGVPPI
jgi:hypothetical protein